MTKTRLPTRAIRGNRKPGWISDTENQRKWNDRFIATLKRDANLDPAIAAIATNSRLAGLCATKIRFYVDKGLTLYFNEQAKVRGAKHRKELEGAIEGLRKLSNLYTSRGDQILAAFLGALEDQLSQEMGRCKPAVAAKSRGRDRDHSFLDNCHSFLESELQHSVTYKTIATLVNAGFEVNGNAPREPITEEHIRKNLAKFKRNNPNWHNEILPRFRNLLTDPETK